ncbi:MAG: HEPN domain-containing protein [Candidatus Hydrogenedentota bacterium]
MSEFAEDSWRRALASLESAKQIVVTDPDSSASRTYYAVFHAVTALFAFREVTFSKHAQLRAAVHRDLVRAGELDPALGREFDDVLNLRQTGDYGGKYHVSTDDALDAIQKASRIIDAVQTLIDVHRGTK